MNRHLQEASKRQDQLEARVDQNSSDISKNEKDVEGLRQELRRALARIDNDKETRDDALCDELRERDIRRLNIVIHGLAEPDQTVHNNSDRIEADRRTCSDLFATMGLRTRGTDLRFCRRVGERGTTPRPIVIGLNSEEEKRVMLARSRQLRGGRYDNVAVVPDLTKMQRRGEEKLSNEAEARNGNLTADDREKGLRWIVVGKRGEKRLIKGVEREPQRDRAPHTLGQYLPLRGGNSAAAGGGNTGTNSRELGARQRTNAPQFNATSRLLSPIRDSGIYVPVQHADERQATNGNQQQHRQQYQSNYSANGGGYGGNRSDQNGYGYGYGNGNGFNGLSGNGNSFSGNGNGFSGNGNGYGSGYGSGNGQETRNNGGSGYGNGNGPGMNGYGSGNRPGNGYGYGNHHQYDMAGAVGGQVENIQHADPDRLDNRQGGPAGPVVPQPGQPRQRLGSKRGREAITDISPPRTRQRQ
jgi:hypothetical protein